MDSHILCPICCHFSFKAYLLFLGPGIWSIQTRLNQILSFWLGNNGLELDGSKGVDETRFGHYQKQNLGAGQCTQFIGLQVMRENIHASITTSCSITIVIVLYSSNVTRFIPCKTRLLCTGGWGGDRLRHIYGRRWAVFKKANGRKQNIPSS